MLKPTPMKLFLLSFLSLILSSTLLAQKPTLQLKESKRVITLDDEKGGNTSIEMRSMFTPAGTKKVSTEWVISGVKGKDWDFTKGDEKSDIIEVNFKRVGNYSVSLNVTYAVKKTLKNGEVEEEEFDISVDNDNFITVTNNLDELTQLLADSNFIKLVKRAGDYTVKEKYANDPTPYIFLAKGLFGVYRKDLKDPMIQDPFEEAITACATAIERDENGVFKMPIHKMWLNGFQLELLNNGVRYILEEEDGYPIVYSNENKEKTAETLSEILDACESYSSITRNPMGIKMIEAAIRYNNRDAKTANLIWKTELPNLMNLTDKDFENWTQADKDALRVGLILSAQALMKRDGSTINARPMLKKAEKWFEYDKEWIAFYEKKYNSFSEQ
jgi:transcriptional/translational regulatory protein YebC/TACO1